MAPLAKLPPGGFSFITKYSVLGKNAGKNESGFLCLYTSTSYCDISQPNKSECHQPRKTNLLIFSK